MWRIKVKVVRLWKQYSAQRGETMEIVLVDSQVSTFTVSHHHFIYAIVYTWIHE